MAKAISVENVSKAYQIGEFKTGSLAQDIQRKWMLMRGKDDPYAIIGEKNDRTAKGNSNIVWSLKDINFSISKGEAVGIIGRNGAGKSTLLKLLSKITSPTTGTIKVNGRVASLLEVGTGFHPELTGRENVFLNGAILGMRKAEIERKFDEIVDFSGVERYIDTPVKRYSSGMYVRLAFAVAAHLESEILIVDEVLAVGDAEFQKKCLGKMGDISTGQGRTVLYVSHNMASVKAFCDSAILLKEGRVEDIGDVESITYQYLAHGITNLTEQVWSNEHISDDQSFRLIRAAVFAEGKTTVDPVTTTDPVVMEVDFENYEEGANLDITIDIFDSNGTHVTHFGMICNPNGGLSKGKFRTKGVIPGNLLNTNRFVYNILVGRNQREVVLNLKDVLVVDIEDAIPTKGNNYAKLPGVIHPIIPWQTNRLV